jgi:carboxyl-terminal processing protease
MGERDIDNAMPWDKIDPSEFKFWDKQTNFDVAIDNSKKRIAENPKFKLIDENAQWIDQRNKESVYNLNIDQFKAEQKAIEEKAKKFKSIADYKNSLEFKSLPYEQDAMKTDSSLKEKRDRWHESLSKDIYVEEALNVLDDLQPKNAGKKVVTKIKKDPIKS